MHSLTLHYSVQNGGDGSAYPRFMSSKELAEWDQDHMNEGWGEPCVGSITLESESPIRVKEEIETPETFLVKMLEDEEDPNLEEFIQKFFPKGKQVFTVKTRKTNNEKYLYNDVFIEDNKVTTVFRSKEKSGEIFQKILNKQKKVKNKIKI